MASAVRTLTRSDETVASKTPGLAACPQTTGRDAPARSHHRHTLPAAWKRPVRRRFEAHGTRGGNDLLRPSAGTRAPLDEARHARRIRPNARASCIELPTIAAPRGVTNGRASIEASLGTTRFPRLACDRRSVHPGARRGALRSGRTRTELRLPVRCRLVDANDRSGRLPGTPVPGFASEATPVAPSGEPRCRQRPLRWAGAATAVDSSTGTIERNAARRGGQAPGKQDAGPTCHGPDAGRGNPAAAAALFEV